MTDNGVSRGDDLSDMANIADSLYTGAHQGGAPRSLRPPVGNTSYLGESIDGSVARPR